MVLALDTYVRSETYQTTFIPENINRFIVAVADGMGGHNAGEVASELVLSNLSVQSICTMPLWNPLDVN